jgi:hypothetical protein
MMPDGPPSPVIAQSFRARSSPEAQAPREAIEIVGSPAMPDGQCDGYRLRVHFYGHLVNVAEQRDNVFLHVQFVE